MSNISISYYKKYLYTEYASKLSALFIDMKTPEKYQELINRNMFFSDFTTYS